MKKDEPKRVNFNWSEIRKLADEIRRLTEEERREELGETYDCSEGNCRGN